MQQLLRPPGERVAKRNARKEELVKCVPAPRPKTHHAAGIDHQACTVPRRARSLVIANTQAPSHADPRTATLHACAKLRPKAVFSFGPCTARFLFRQREKKMGGASPHGPCPLREQDLPDRRRGGLSAPRSGCLCPAIPMAAYTVAALRFPSPGGAANRAASSKPPRFIRCWRRFGDFPRPMGRTPHPPPATADFEEKS